MELKVLWTDFSKNQLKKIFGYYKKRAGENVALRIVVGIIGEVSKLTNAPEIGQKESLLKDFTKTYYYLLHKNYKIIYVYNQEIF